MPKRIGYILALFPGISETFIGTEIRAVENLGVDIEIITLSKTEQTRQPVDEPLYKKHWCKSTLKLTHAIIGMLTTIPGWFAAWQFINAQTCLNKKSLLFNSFKIAYFVRKLELSHLHAHFAQGQTAHAIATSLLCRIPVSFTCHGHDVYSNAQDLALKVKHATFTVSVCCDLTQHLRAIVPNQKIATVFCGVNIDKYQFQPATHTPNTLLFIGRLIPKKGLSTMLDALQMLPKEQRPAVDIVGSGPDLIMLQQKAQVLGIADYVRFLHEQSSEWLVANAAKYRAIIAPCELAGDGDRDTGPVVVKEAIAMGIPVITTRFMGLKEIVNEQMAYIAEPGDHESLARAIASCVTATPTARFAKIDYAYQHLQRWFTDKQQAKHLCYWFEHQSELVDQCADLTDSLKDF